MNNKNNLVGIVLGSASDINEASKISEILKQLEIGHEVTVASAHRTPDDVSSYASRAADRGIKVVIAVAGLSAALPGVIAAHTLLPVIGVPVDSGTLAGIDALLAIAQMPPGVPVTSVGINGSKNAALNAARILALDDEKVALNLKEWVKLQEEKTRNSREKISPLPQAPEEAFKKAEY